MQETEADSVLTKEAEEFEQEATDPNAREATKELGSRVRISRFLLQLYTVWVNQFLKVGC